MANSAAHRFANDESETPLNSVRPRMAKCQTVPNQPAFVEGFESGTDVLSLVETARRKSGLKLDYLAHLSGLKSKGQLSSALSGRENFQLKWLDAWPREFWNEFLPLIRASREGSATAKREQRKRILLTAIELLLDEEVA